MSTSNLCLCGSGIKQQNCCDPYITGVKLPTTAEALMRSRYVAYATGNDAYLLDTWHASTRPEDTSPTAGGVQWIGLQILSTEQGAESDDEGVVEFRARCRIDETAAGLDERSEFLREEGRWYYVDGTAIQPQRTRENRVNRNDPCPCGSGKKYKKCCGAA